MHQTNQRKKGSNFRNILVVFKKYKNKAVMNNTLNYKWIDVLELFFSSQRIYTFLQVFAITASEKENTYFM